MFPYLNLPSESFPDVVSRHLERVPHLLVLEIPAEAKVSTAAGVKLEQQTPKANSQSENGFLKTFIPRMTPIKDCSEHYTIQVWFYVFIVIFSVTSL